MKKQCDSKGVHLNDDLLSSPQSDVISCIVGLEICAVLWATTNINIHSGI
jgi:hypothetical protein